MCNLNFFSMADLHLKGIWKPIRRLFSYCFIIQILNCTKVITFLQRFFCFLFHFVCLHMCHCYFVHCMFLLVFIFQNNQLYLAFIDGQKQCNILGVKNVTTLWYDSKADVCTVPDSIATSFSKSLLVTTFSSSLQGLLPTQESECHQCLSNV